MNLRKDYGLPVTASDKDLKAAEDKQQHDDVRRFFGLPTSASDKDLKAAENADQEADIARLKALGK